ncbi:hypothetical protein E2C01_004543 [Portunus trituberculatus]|uniref:Uncharacterized protein n=1 Tax=Portunus trituberculatus TaxID=210409 RepID=A0A5B7CS15_PORTR|nr:hypothetical protein [Portunus trituberculatus]
MVSDGVPDSLRGCGVGWSVCGKATPLPRPVLLLVSGCSTLLLYDLFASFLNTPPMPPPTTGLSHPVPNPTTPSGCHPHFHHRQGEALEYETSSSLVL